MMGVCEGECMGWSPGDEPLTLMRCLSCGLQELYETLETHLWPSLQFKGHKGEIFFFFLELFFLFYCSSFSWHDACRVCGGRGGNI